MNRINLLGGELVGNFENALGGKGLWGFAFAWFLGGFWGFGFVAAAQDSESPVLAISAEDWGEIDEEEPSPADRVDWAAIRGVNYIAGYADSPRAMWTDYDGAAIRREMAAAARMQFNSLRVWFNYDAYAEAPSEFLGNVADFVSAARASGLTLMPVLFDARGVDRAAYQEGTQSVGDAIARYTSRPELYRLRPGYERFLGMMADPKYAARALPATNDASVVFWGGWSPSPANARLGESFRPRYRVYLDKVLAPLKDDPTIVAWEVVNEPGARPMFIREKPASGWREFASAMIAEVRRLDPDRPVTLGFPGGHPGPSPLTRKLDFLSLHLCQRTVGELIAEVRQARKLGRGRPVVVGEAGARLFGEPGFESSEEYQRRNVRQTVAALERAGAGYYLWQLTTGKAMTPWTGLIDAEGAIRPAGKWLAERSLPRPVARRDASGL